MIPANALHDAFEKTCDPQYSDYYSFVAGWNAALRGMTTAELLPPLPTSVEKAIAQLNDAASDDSRIDFIGEVERLRLAIRRALFMASMRSKF